MCVCVCVYEADAAGKKSSLIQGFALLFFLVGRRAVRFGLTANESFIFRLPFIVPFFIFYFFLMRTLSMLQNPFLHSIEITTPRSLYFSFLRLA